MANEKKMHAKVFGMPDVEIYTSGYDYICLKQDDSVVTIHPMFVPQIIQLMQEAYDKLEWKQVIEVVEEEIGK